MTTGNVPHSFVQPDRQTNALLQTRENFKTLHLICFNFISRQPALKVWLGLGTKEHLVRVKKRSCFAGKSLGGVVQNICLWCLEDGCKMSQQLLK